MLKLHTPQLNPLVPELNSGHFLKKPGTEMPGATLHAVGAIQGGTKRTHVFESACDFFLWGYLKSKVYV